MVRNAQVARPKAAVSTIQLLLQKCRKKDGGRSAGRPVVTPAHEGLFDVPLANDPSDVVILLSEKDSSIGTAQTNRIKPMDNKLRLDLGGLHRGGEPAGKLGDRFLWRGGRCKQPESNLRL